MPGNQNLQPVAIIPAYCPSPALPGIVRGLIASGRFQAIVCVDDGSPGEHAPVFRELRELGCVVIPHHCNLGKGAALKTGLNYMACNFPHSVGAVTVDADGQHLVEDCVRVGDRLIERRSSLVLGCRGFEGRVPLRSRVGNSISRAVVHLFGGVRISDTQTGLRGIPYAFIAPLLGLKSTGYDFELEMIMLTRTKNVPIEEVAIRTVYLDGNVRSHFNPVLDSLRVYFIFLRHSAVSITATLLDYAIFALLYLTWGNLAGSLIIARVSGGAYQFVLSRYFVFKSHGEIKSEFIKYGLLIFVMSALAVALTQYFSVTFGMNPFAVKVVVETLLYLFSFSVMNTYIFINSTSLKER